MSFRLVQLFISFCFILTAIAAPAASELSRPEIEQRLAQRKSGAVDLSNLDLTDADLSGLDLHGADFFSSRLAGAKAKGANLAGANFTRSELQNADFSGADLTRARIIGGGRGVKFVKARLTDADLGADPANQGMVPVRAELVEANFDGADLTRVNFTHAVLTSASFTGAVVTGARFDYAVLDGSNLTLTR